MSKIDLLPFVRKGLTAYINDGKDYQNSKHASVTINAEMIGYKSELKSNAQEPKTIDPKDYLNISFSSKDNGGNTSQVYNGSNGLQLNSAQSNLSFSRTFYLTGPAEIQAVNSSAVKRVSPSEGSTPMSKDFMPYIEFHDIDFPWRYTPIKETTINGKQELRPWIALIACELNSEEKQYVLKADKGRYFLEICKPKEVLPMVSDLAKLAHAQREVNGANVIESSRVLCFTSLKPNTEYIAFLIPTFQLGLLDEARQNATVIDAAWSENDARTPKGIFPVYYQWKFKTGEADFVKLANLMRPLYGQDFILLDDKLKVDVKDTGVEYIDNASKQNTLRVISENKDADDFGILPVHVALKKSGVSEENPSQATKALVNAQSASLKSLLLHSPVFTSNKVDKNDIQANLNEDPWVVPPVYAGRHLLSNKEDLNSSNKLLHQLNLDFENRIAAGIGASIVQENQEDFVHRAWQKVEDINFQNQIIKEIALFNQSDQIGQRRVLNYRNSALGISQGDLRKDIAMRIATRASRSIGAESIFSICNNPENVVKCTLAKPSGEIRCGIELENIKTMGNPLFWYSFLSNKGIKKRREDIKNCLIYRKIQIGQEPLKNAYESPFYAINEFLTCKMRVFGKNDINGSNTIWRFELVDNYIWRHRDEYNKFLTKNCFGFFFHNNLFGKYYDINKWLKNYKKEYKNGRYDSHKVFYKGAEYFKQKNDINTIKQLYVLDENDEDKLMMAIPTQEFVKIRKVLVEHKKCNKDTDVCMIKFAKNKKSKKEDKVLYLVDINSGNLNFYHFQDQLVKKTNLYERFNTITAKKETYSQTYFYINENPKTSYFKYAAYWRDHLYIISEAIKFLYNVLNNPKSYSIVVGFSSRRVISVTIKNQTGLKPDFLNTFDISFESIVLMDYNKNVAIGLNEEKEAFIREYISVIESFYSSIQDILEYIAIPNYAKYTGTVEGEPFKMMDYFGNYKDFEELGNTYIKNLASLIGDNVIKGLDSIKDNSEQPTKEPIVTTPDFATKQNQEKLEEILKTYKYGGRTPEELTNRLWNIANMRYPIMAYPEFFDPTVFYLRQLDTRFVLPSANDIKENTISMFESNKAFEEAFLAGMNTEMGKELLWREYPTDERGSYFRKFWDKASLPKCVDDYFDIKEMHEWNDELGKNHRIGVDSLVVFVVKGKLMRAYPNTAVSIMPFNGSQFETSDRIVPEMTSWLNDDTYIVGFPKQKMITIKSKIISYGQTYCLTFEEQPQGLQFNINKANKTTIGSDRFAADCVHNLAIWGGKVNCFLENLK